MAVIVFEMSKRVKALFSFHRAIHTENDINIRKLLFLERAKNIYLVRKIILN